MNTATYPRPTRALWGAGAPTYGTPDMTDATRPRTPYERYRETEAIEDAALHRVRNEADACAVVGERLGAALWSALRRARKVGRADRLRVWLVRESPPALLLRDDSATWTVRR